MGVIDPAPGPRPPTPAPRPPTPVDQPLPFVPAWWLPSSHLQTLWPSFCRPRLALEGTWERVELADGDFIDLVWHGTGARPLVLVIHGLEGSLGSHYVTPTLASLHDHGFDTVFMHLRGCSGEPNRLARGYHSGATEDVVEILAHLKSRGRAPAAAVGFSLGGNLLLKYLGESGSDSALEAAVVVSVPFRLWRAAARLEQGASRIYGRHLLAGLKGSYRRKFSILASPLDVDLDAISTIYAFDDRVTAPLHGFAGADDYYRRCSSHAFMGAITVPVQVIHALDDPFMYPGDVPGAQDIGPRVHMDVMPHGGHVGFVAGANPWRPRYWLDHRIATGLGQLLGR